MAHHAATGGIVIVVGGGRGGQVKLATSGSRLNAEAKTLAGLIAYAYDVRSYQVPYTPALEPFGDLFYDIAAKAAGDAPRSAAEFRQMTQSLLADRFKLQVHRDKREIPVYALVQSRKGARLRESASDVKAGSRFTASGRNYEVTMTRATMEDLVRVIENSLVDRPVLDLTGLAGEYDFGFTYTPNTPANRTEDAIGDIDIFSAVQALGLQLKPQKAAMDVLIVDHAEKPSAN